MNVGLMFWGFEYQFRAAAYGWGLAFVFMFFLLFSQLRRIGGTLEYAQ